MGRRCLAEVQPTQLLRPTFYHQSVLVRLFSSPAETNILSGQYQPASQSWQAPGLFSTKSEAAS